MSEWFPPNWIEIAVRLVMATFLSALIGLEREIRNKPAGLRTHMLVGLGAAALCLFGLDLVDQFAGREDAVQMDFIRVINGVIGGLGFLGAGAIIQSRGEVHGMTTAAGIWIVGAIGVGCGTGNYYITVLMVVIALVSLAPVGRLEKRLGIAEADRPEQQNRESG